MYRYVCHECGEEFDEPHIYEERHGLDHGPYEKWSVCPCCGDTNYSEVSIDGREDQ